MTQSNGVYWLKVKITDLQPMAKSSQQMCFLWLEQGFFCCVFFFLTEPVANILKLRFHVKIWILQLLLKKLEDVNIGFTYKSQLKLCHSLSVHHEPHSVL